MEATLRRTVLLFAASTWGRWLLQGRTLDLEYLAEGFGLWRIAYQLFVNSYGVDSKLSNLCLLDIFHRLLRTAKALLLYFPLFESFWKICRHTIYYINLLVLASETVFYTLIISFAFAEDFERLKTPAP